MSTWKLASLRDIQVLLINQLGELWFGFTGKALTDSACLQYNSLSRSDLPWISQWIFWVWVEYFFFLFSWFSVWFGVFFLLHIIAPICWLGLSEHWRYMDTLTMFDVLAQWLRDWSTCFSTVKILSLNYKKTFHYCYINYSGLL